MAMSVALCRPRYLTVKTRDRAVTNIDPATIISEAQIFKAILGCLFRVLLQMVKVEP